MRRKKRRLRAAATSDVMRLSACARWCTCGINRATFPAGGTHGGVGGHMGTLTNDALFRNTRYALPLSVARRALTHGFVF